MTKQRIFTKKSSWFFIMLLLWSLLFLIINDCGILLLKKHSLIFGEALFW